MFWWFVFVKSKRGGGDSRGAEKLGRDITISSYIFCMDTPLIMPFRMTSRSMTLCA